MPTWGIVLSMIGYLGIGMLANWWMCEGDAEEMAQYWPVLIIWPIIILPQIVIWAAKYISQCCHRGE